MQPIEDRLLGMLSRITQDSVELAFRQFRETRGEEMQLRIKPLGCVSGDPGAESGAAAGVMLTERSVAQPSLGFLDNLYISPPVTEAELGEFNLSEFLLAASATSTLSDSGYASVQLSCNCYAEPCICFSDCIK